MNTGQPSLTAVGKTDARNSSRKTGELSSVKALGAARQGTGRKPPPASPVIARATRNIGLSLYEMLGMAELMRVAYEKKDLASVHDRLAALMAEASGISSSLSDILELAELERETPRAASEDFDLTALLLDAAEAARGLLGAKPVTVMDASSPGPVVVRSDRDKIKRIVTGLMSNAARFTDRGRIALIVCRDHDALRLTVADTSGGMTQEQIDALSDSFDHGCDLDRNDPATSGLGLRIVSALVKQLHGGLSIASKPGEGTIVEVTLPLSPLKMK
jgi:signal transduction histidine kinase